VVAGLTLVPRWRLLAALGLGAALIALTVVSVLLWPVAVAYHAVLGWAIGNHTLSALTIALCAVSGAGASVCLLRARANRSQTRARSIER